MTRQRPNSIAGPNRMTNVPPEVLAKPWSIKARGELLQLWKTTGDWRAELLERQLADYLGDHLKTGQL